MQTEGYLIGLVDDVYDASDRTTVGQVFLFKEGNALKLKYGSTIYYLISESFISNPQTPPP